MAQTGVGAQVAQRFPPQLGAASTLLVGCLSHASGLPCGYTSLVIDPPDLPGWINESITLFDVNDAGVAVGRVQPLDNLPCLWSESTGVVLLPMPPGAGTAQATAINNDGWILVNGEVAGDQPQGYVYIPSGSGWTIVQIPWTASPCWASGINDLGEVVGWYMTPIPGGGPGELVEIGYRWTLGKGMGDVAIAGWNATRCVDINNAGVICGNVRQDVVAAPGVGVRGFVLDESGPTIIQPPLDFTRCWCERINSSGVIGGNARKGTGQLATGGGFLLDASSASMLFMAPAPGWTLWTLRDINDSGVATGALFKPIEMYAACVSSDGEVTAVADLLPRDAPVGNSCHAIGEDGSLYMTWNVSMVKCSPAASGADLDCDAFVGAGDLAMLLAAWGRADSAADLDGSGVVGGEDIGILLAFWND